MKRSYYQQLPLQPLGPEAIQELLTDLLGVDSSLKRLTELIRERTGGNPFFIEEIVRSLEETGSLVGRTGAYRLCRPAEDIAVPPTVQSILAARIDRLPERDKQVLQTASVIGQRFSEPILRRAADLGDEHLSDATHALMAAELLYQEALYPEVEYAFKHPLTREVAYRSQLAERRARIHASVARAMEELGSGKLGERAALLAYHYELAGNAREAARWHRSAAEWVGANSAGEALRHWESMRDLVDTLPDTPQNLAERATVRAQVMNYLARMGDLEGQSSKLFQEAREHATQSGDPSAMSEVLNGFGYLQLYTGAVTEAVNPLLEAIRYADSTQDIGLRVAVRYGLCVAYHSAGRLRECLAVTEEGLELAHGDLELGADRMGWSPSLGFACWRGLVLTRTGHPREGATALDRAIEYARTLATSQQLTALCVLHASYVNFCEVTSETASALAHGREAVDYAERTGNHISRIYTRFHLGRANILVGQWRDALKVLDEAMAIGRERRLQMAEGWVLGSMADAHLGLGDRERALTLAEEAIGVCRRGGARVWEASAQLTRIHALREIHGVQATTRIEEAFAETEAWLEMSGAKSYEPFLHIERSELARLAGDEAAREQELREAHRLFMEIGAPIRAAEVAKALGL
jgi:adenylate cyclase